MTSAEIAKHRLLWIVALDRLALDSGRRLVRLKQSGHTWAFDETIGVLADEVIDLLYDLETGEGLAIVRKDL